MQARRHPEAGVTSTALCVAHEATGAVALYGLEQLAERLGALSRLKVPVTSVSKIAGVCVERSEYLCQSSQLYFNLTKSNATLSSLG
jgi:hypothetical protein